MREIVFATNNPNKLLEVRHLLQNTYDIKSLKSIGCLEELPETHDTLEENAMEKATYVATHFGVDCFAEDTGLEVNALNGDPGVYSARFAGADRNSEANMKLLLKRMTDKNNRSAQFRTIIALLLGGKQFTFEGIVRGKIGLKRIGDQGFGYDSIFIPEGNDRTFAQMSMEEKSEMSHRKRALDKLIEFLNKN